MAIDDWLLAILVCPEDKGSLWYVADEDTLYNPRLRRRYAIRDGIPDLLIEESEQLGESEHERLAARAAASDGVLITGGGERPGTSGS